MNIDNNFVNAKVYLVMSREKFDSHDYATALSSLAKAFGHIRELIQQIYALSIESSKDLPAGTEISP